MRDSEESLGQASADTEKPFKHDVHMLEHIIHLSHPQ
jgi:hypothetical protein